MSAADLAGAAASYIAAAAGPTSWQFAILRGLQSKPVYEGTKSEGVRKRRAKRKAAKAARKVNRRCR